MSAANRSDDTKAPPPQLRVGGRLRKRPRGKLATVSLLFATAAAIVLGLGASNAAHVSLAPPRVTATTFTSISVSWNSPIRDAGGRYELDRDGTAVDYVRATRYTFVRLDCGRTYTIRVAALDSGGNVATRSAIRASTRACGAFYVSPAGLDSNPGTLEKPWRTITKAAAALRPGQTAYLRAGVYEEGVSGHCGIDYNRLTWRTSGTPTSPITISGFQGEEKSVIVKTAVKMAGNYEGLMNLVVDANHNISPFDNSCDGAPNVQISGREDTLSGVEVRNSAMSGIYLAGADGAEVVRNWIHSNGTHWNLDHGISWASGKNGVAGSNIVQDNYANGIKIGPNAQSVLVTENTVNGNGRSGIIVGGDDSHVSSLVIVADNIVTWNGFGRGGGFGLRTYWGSAGAGTGNQAIQNLVYGNHYGDWWFDGGGMSERDSILVDPLFVDRSSGDFHLATGSAAIDGANVTYSDARAIDGVPRPQGAGPDLGAFER